MNPSFLVLCSTVNYEPKKSRELREQCKLFLYMSGGTSFTADLEHRISRIFGRALGEVAKVSG